MAGDEVLERLRQLRDPMLRLEYIKGVGELMLLVCVCMLLFVLFILVILLFMTDVVSPVLVL